MTILLRIRISELTDEEDRSVWRTYANKFGARNTNGDVRYFTSHADAADYARGNIAGLKNRNLKKARSKEPKERIQTYDFEKDMEQAS